MDRFCLIKKKYSFWQSTIYQDFLFTILAFVSKEVCLIPKHKTNFSHVLCQKFYNFSNYIYLEKGKATHSSILAWRIPWTIQTMGLQRVTNEWLSLSLSITFMTMIDHEVIIVHRVWWKQNVFFLFFFFVICVSSCSTTTYWECYTFPIEFPWHFCEKSINHMSLGQYLNLYYV